MPGVYRRKTYRKSKVAPKPKLPMRYQVADTAYKAYKAAMYVKNLINVEKKHLDIQTTINPDWDGDYFVLNVPPAGTGDSQRIGDSILNKSFAISATIHTNGANVVVRTILIWDKQNKINTLSDLIEFTGSVYSVLSPFNKDNSREFRVLSDRVHESDAHHPLVYFSHAKSHLDNHTQFEAGTTNINSGAYKFFILCARNTSVPIVDIVSRFTYIDN